VLLLLSACGNAAIPEAQIEADSHHRTLHVLALNVYTAVLRQAESAINQSWADEGRAFTLELTSYTPDEREHILSRLQTALMSGQGYDMFFWDGHPLMIHSASGLFADFYALIDQNPTTSREDFYTNILEAWEFDGGLYIFPLSVEFMYVGISSKIPEAFIDRFTQHSTITTRELMRIYLDLHQAYPEEFSHMAFGRGTDFNLHSAMGSFIDFEKGNAYISRSAFASFLEDMRQISDMSIAVDYTNIRWPYEAMIAGLSHYYTFLTLGRDWWFADPLGALFDPPVPSFLHFIPLADEHGRLIIEQYNRNGYWFDTFIGDWHYTLSPAWGSVSISAAGDGALAWEFIQYIISAMVNHHARPAAPGTPVHYLRYFGSHNLMSPIKSTYLRPHLRSYFYRVFEDVMTMDNARRRFYGLSVMPDERRLEIEAAIDRLEAFNKMPAVVMPYLPGSLYEGPLEEFMLGRIHARQAADIIHNRVALWLIE